MSAQPHEPTETAWPLAGEEAFAHVPADWRARHADSIEAALREHVLEAWYPLTVDQTLGGFRTDLDRRWRPIGPDDRMLEYQARQTRSVARLGRAFPSQGQWADHARHGATYMDHVMRDTAEGGWFWLVGRDESPLAAGTKHAHSTAYVIGAMVEVYRLTGDEAALDTAQEAFDWLDATLHDAEYGGYFGWATRDGRVIRERSDVDTWSRDVDPLGHEIGLKDLNVHSDLSESLRLLLAERPSPVLLARTRELYDLLENRFATTDGSMHYLLNPDLTPAPSAEYFGFSFQSAYRMRLLAPFIGRSADDALQFARRLVDHAVARGWAGERDGVFDVIGPGVRPRRTWWIQTEAIQALLLLAVNLGEEQYRVRIERMLRMVGSEMLDRRYRGWHQVPTSEWSLIDRLRVSRWPKAQRWKDPSHETDMSLAALRMLRGLAGDAPIEA